MVAHLFESEPDDRQSTSFDAPSKFRPQYRQLTDTEKQLHDDIKEKAGELDDLFEKLRPGRCTSIAGTKLEESIMWAIKGLTS